MPAEGKVKLAGATPGGSRVKTRSSADSSAPGRNELSQLTELFTAFAIRGLATLGVADVLALGPASVETIADAVGGNTDALYRTMRFTATMGVFAELPGRIFAMTPAAEYLRSDVPGSMRSRLMIDDSTLTRLRVLAEIPHTLRTGESGYHKVHGTGPFEAGGNRPAAAQIAVQAPGSARMLAEGVLAASDFTDDRVVVDVGGGTGTMIGSVLARHPHLRGVLYDLPTVISEAPNVLAPLGVAQRCTLTGGDMFQAVPAGGDTYLLSFVLHDWTDDRAAIILANLRDVMSQSARLLVIEVLIGDTGGQAALRQDFMMMVNGGGRERTRAEHANLLAQAGFRLAKSTPIGPGLCVLEARPASGHG